MKNGLFLETVLDICYNKMIEKYLLLVEELLWERRIR